MTDPTDIQAVKQFANQHGLAVVDEHPGRPHVVEGSFNVEIVAGDAGPGEAHRPVLAASVGALSQGRCVEAENLARIQPGGA